MNMDVKAALGILKSAADLAAMPLADHQKVNVAFQIVAGYVEAHLTPPKGAPGGLKKPEANPPSENPEKPSEATENAGDKPKNEPPKE